MQLYENSPLKSTIDGIVLTGFGLRRKITATLHTEKLDIEVMKVVSIDTVRDYVKNVGDEIFIEFMMGYGDYVKDLFPYRSNMEVTIAYQDLTLGNAEDQETIDESNPAKSFVRYKAIFLMKENPNPKGSEVDSTDKQTLNLAGIVNVKLQLIDRALEVLRAKTTGGVFKGSTRTDLIRSILGGESDKLKIDSKKAIDGMEIITADNKSGIKQVILPQGLRIVNLPSHIQERMGGFYSAGLGNYLQTYGRRTMWFVYPLFDTKRFDDDVNKITFYAVPRDRFIGIERTYKPTTTTGSIPVLVMGEKNQSDSGEAQMMDEGIGFRMTNPDTFFSTSNKFVEMKETGPVAKRSKINVEVINEKRKDGVNFAPIADTGISVNNFAQYSRVAQRLGSMVTVTWRNADTSILYPGMPCKYVFVEKGQAVEVKGIILFCHAVTQLETPGIASTIYSTTCKIGIFAERTPYGADTRVLSNANAGKYVNPYSIAPVKAIIKAIAMGEDSPNSVFKRDQETIDSIKAKFPGISDRMATYMVYNQGVITDALINEVVRLEKLGLSDTYIDVSLKYMLNGNYDETSNVKGEWKDATILNPFTGAKTNSGLYMRYLMDTFPDMSEAMIGFFCDPKQTKSLTKIQAQTALLMLKEGYSLEKVQDWLKSAAMGNRVAITPTGSVALASLGVQGQLGGQITNQMEKAGYSSSTVNIVAQYFDKLSSEQAKVVSTALLYAKPKLSDQEVRDLLRSVFSGSYGPTTRDGQPAYTVTDLYRLKPSMSTHDATLIASLAPALTKSQIDSLVKLSIAGKIPMGIGLSMMICSGFDMSKTGADSLPPLSVLSNPGAGTKTIDNAVLAPSRYYQDQYPDIKPEILNLIMSKAPSITMGQVNLLLTQYSSAATNTSEVEMAITRLPPYNPPQVVISDTVETATNSGTNSSSVTITYPFEIGKYIFMTTKVMSASHFDAVIYEWLPVKTKGTYPYVIDKRIKELLYQYKDFLVSENSEASPLPFTTFCNKYLTYETMKEAIAYRYSRQERPALGVPPKFTAKSIRLKSGFSGIEAELNTHLLGYLITRSSPFATGLTAASLGYLIDSVFSGNYQTLFVVVLGYCGVDFSLENVKAQHKAILTDGVKNASGTAIMDFEAIRTKLSIPGGFLSLDHESTLSYFLVSQRFLTDEETTQITSLSLSEIPAKLTQILKAKKLEPGTSNLTTLTSHEGDMKILYATASVSWKPSFTMQLPT